MAKIISLVGLPAVGKTTTISLLKELNSNCHFYSTELTEEKQQLIQNLHRADNVNFDLIQEIYFENLLFHSVELEKLLDSSDVIVLDRGFEDTLAVAKYFSGKGVFNNFTKYELKFSNLKKYFSDFIIFLYAEINAIKLRKENRDNYLGRSKRPNDDVFIDDISMFYTKWYKTNTKAFFVDTSLAKPLDVALLILEIINKEIKSDGIQ